MTERADIGGRDDSDEILGAFASDEEEDSNCGFDDSIPTDELDSTNSKEDKILPKPQNLAGARPLVRKRAGKETQGKPTADLMDLYRIQMMQDQARREDDIERREFERDED